MSATASTAPQNKSLEWMNRLRANPKIPLIVAGAAAIAILVAMVLWAKSPDYRPTPMKACRLTQSGLILGKP